MAITAQEAWTDRGTAVRIPTFVREVVERIGFEARADRRVDRRSGVSQRLPISVLENAVSNAERRARTSREAEVIPRISDIYAAAPSVTGKLELEYEGELVGGDAIARELIRRAAGAAFRDRADGVDLERVVAWFDTGGVLRVSGEEPSKAGVKAFATVDGLVDLVRAMGLPDLDRPGVLFGACELALEGLAAMKRITRNEDQTWSRGKGPRTKD
jgi:magnesium chelatase subunit I